MLVVAETVVSVAYDIVVLAPSSRRDELLERAYSYVLAHGLTSLSLRPLAAAIGSSPRVLLFLFGNKDALVRALLARARADELEALRRLRSSGSDPDLAEAAAEVWGWLAAEEHRALLRLWVEAYARSLVEPEGPWGDFARETVADWLAVLAAAQPREQRATAAGEGRRTLALAVLRGALLDLLATDDVARTTLAVHEHLDRIRGSAP